MLSVSSRRASGFTLVEMTIVLGIAGILFGGLWKMLSVGNAQMRDQATASQQLQLMSAVGNYLQSADGQTFLNGILAGNAATLALPTNAACAAPARAGFCPFLPAGFFSSTQNPYGQTYQIGVRRDANTYSYMVLTTGAKRIPDASGGRISAALGGDGGFVYSSNVCNAAFNSTACGAFGGWTAAVANYGLPVPVNGGYVASRSYPSQSLGSGDVWLARNPLTNDPNRIYNTMTTTLYLGEKDLDFATMGGATGGTMLVRSGTIDLGTAGRITGAAGLSDTFISLSGTLNGGTNPLLRVVSSGGSTGCWTFPGVPATCQAAAYIQGDMQVTGMLYANALYSATFIYGTFAAPSDSRLKENVALLQNSLDHIMELKPVTFTYKANKQKGVGVLAQDLEKVYPQLVLDQPNGMKMVNYDGLIGPLIGAVQELKKENDDLRAQLKAQIVRQKEMEKRLERQK